jgi:predicted Rossmann fold flavoprotein
MDEPDVIVIGAGAAGIIAAWKSASLGARTCLLEKTPRIGTKILISGGGKCNITHDGPIEDVLRAFRSNEARFIRPACYRFTNRMIVEMLTSKGLRVYTRPDGRIFPIDQTAKDVVQILRGYLESTGVEIRLETPVRGIEGGPKGVSAVMLGGERIACSRIVLATGGSSYANSGTTGDGWPWTAQLGHKVETIRPALAPVLMTITGAELPGVALRDVVVKARSGKEIARWRGDMLFTHRGLSGPTILGISRDVAEKLESAAVKLEVDLAPNESFEELGSRLLGWIRAHPKKLLRGFVDDFTPKSLADVVLHTAGIDPATIAAQLGQKPRNRLIETLKAYPLGQVNEVWLDRGEVVAGGVSLDEVDPQSMRSKICPGLYLCGEVLDIAGPVGGYNLQAAFATGFVAGESAARDAGFTG